MNAIFSSINVSPLFGPTLFQFDTIAYKNANYSSWAISMTRLDYGNQNKNKFKGLQMWSKFFICLEVSMGYLKVIWPRIFNVYNFIVINWVYKHILEGAILTNP